MRPIDLVADWHNKFGVGLPSEPTLNPEVCALRIALLTEEKDELYSAVLEGNRVEQLDALCDLQYVLSGAILHTGMRNLVGDEFKSPDVHVVLRNGELSARVMLLSIKIKYLSHQFGAENVIGAVSSFRDLQTILYGLIAVCGFYSVFRDAFQAVHDNNMDKAWSESEISESLPAEYTSTKCVWKPGYYIVRNSIGKIIKPISHKKVDLTPFVK